CSFLIRWVVFPEGQGWPCIDGGLGIGVNRPTPADGKGSPVCTSNQHPLAPNAHLRTEAISPGGQGGGSPCLALGQPGITGAPVNEADIARYPGRGHPAKAEHAR